jgi:hypothetical protein
MFACFYFACKLKSHWRLAQQVERLPNLAFPSRPCLCPVVWCCNHFLPWDWVEQYQLLPLFQCASINTKILRVATLWYLISALFIEIYKQVNVLLAFCKPSRLNRIEVGPETGEDCLIFVQNRSRIAYPCLARGWIPPTTSCPAMGQKLYSALWIGWKHT